MVHREQRRPAHAPHVRAARPRARCRAASSSRPPAPTPTSACCSSRSPACCRCAATAPWVPRPCSSRPAWSTVVEPVTTIRLDTPAGLVVAEVAVRDGHAESVTIRNVPSFSLALDQVVEVDGFGAVRYDIAFGGNFYAIVDLDDLGVPFDRAAKQRLHRRRPGDHGGHQRAGPAHPPRTAGHQRLPPRLPHGPGIDRAPLAARHGDPSRLVRPVAVRHRDERPDGPAARSRRARPAHRTS